MAPARGPLRKDSRPRAKTPAERADEAADVQRRLKQEAADRRAKADAGARTDRAAGSTPIQG
jgi:hypothetical protein